MDKFGKFLNDLILFALLAFLLSIFTNAHSMVIRRDYVEVKHFAAQYEFTFSANKNIHNLQILSCHRHFYYDKQSKFLQLKKNT